jgi:hypothetical protein
MEALQTLGIDRQKIETETKAIIDAYCVAKRKVEERGNAFHEDMLAHYMNTYRYCRLRKERMRCQWRSQAPESC